MLVIMFTLTLSALGPPSSLGASASPLSTPQWLASAVSAIALSAPSNLAFYKHHNLILGTPTLQSSSYVSTNVASTILVQNQPFGNWKNAWNWVYVIECPVICKGCTIDLVSQKIRMENAFA